MCPARGFAARGRWACPVLRRALGHAQNLTPLSSTRRKKVKKLLHPRGRLLVAVATQTWSFPSELPGFPPWMLKSYRLPPRDFQLLSRRAAAALDSEAWLETAPLSLAALLEAPRFPHQARGALQPRHLPLALLCLCRLVANCLGMKGAI